MLFLQLVLLVVLLPDGDSEDVFQEPISFRIILTLSLYNRSWTQNFASAWLDEMQTHGWNNKTGAFIFLWPWSKGNLSNEEVITAEESLYSNIVGMPQCFHDHFSEWWLEYPFQVQLAGGCELHFGEPSVGFMRIAHQGSDLVSFQNTSWWPSPTGGSRAQQFCRLLNEDHEDNELMHKLIIDYCPRYLSSLLDAGKADLQRQVSPEAWLSTGTSTSPGHLLLVCCISGFYPKPVSVMWMQGEQEQQGTRRGDVLPHADGTWYLQVSLDVKATEASGLSCRVRHSSLRGQDLVLYWEQPHSMRLVFLVVMVPLVLLAGLALWLWKCRKTHWRLPCTDLLSERDPSSPGSGTYLRPAQQ
ncbi:T-cell surface glycoprotein CD1a-like [Mustela erminea]|uniref:T-cell surface glycoprotein CD1a-like n=1 Tax=Mustela erminea TaxID=36723 RepID=UPI001386B3BF|nr:T-cell surface glycoprotein CD1a-like [Mustela erminea]